MSVQSVLLLGGNGKISKLLTPLLLARKWTVNSVIRAEDQVPGIKALAGDKSSGGGTLNVLVRSVEAVKSEADAKAIIDEVSPTFVVWSAGAGGKGAPERTFAVDRDAAIHFIKAAAATPSVKRFLMVSYLASRRAKPAWWSDDAWSSALNVNEKVLPRYYQAKIAADEVLYRESRKRPDFVGICLRPGTLTDEPAGKVALGKTKDSRGNVSRAGVAEVAAHLLAVEGDAVKNCWLDLLDGDEHVAAAVQRCVKDAVDCAEGDPVFEEK